jgi:20S proteasome alpha/beta subunit
MKISLNQPNGFSGHFAADNYKYIDATSESIPLPIVDIEHRKNQFNPYVNNGGTVVAIAGPDFVVVAGDSRLSEGYSIVTRGESKLVELTTKTILATSGMFADFCELTKVHMQK